jgi:hypothetical protein
MFESKIIVLPKGILLREQISEVARQISSWLGTLGKLSDADRNSLRLAKCEQTAKGYMFHYSISIGEALSASDTKVQARASRQPLPLDEHDVTIETE